MPRRVYTYPAGMGWHALNLITTIGSFILALGVLLLVINIVASLRRGALAGANPWDAPTLEWSVPSPPPAYNFAVIPRVASRHPLWEDRLQESTGRSSITRGMVLDEGRETIATTPLDGEADLILKMPGDSFAPFLLSLAMAAGFVGLLLHAWWLAGAGSLLTMVAILAWLWPERGLGQIAAAARHG
jgi:cytochrome c oxidase subunit 1/cytochrome c oxidase subunit I+III